MNEENQNSQNLETAAPPTPEVVPGPTTSPTDTPNQVVQSAPIAQPQVMPQNHVSASSLGLNGLQKEKKPLRKKLIKIVVGLIILAGIVVAGSLIFVSYHLPTTEYDNGTGQKFSLRFYKNPTTEVDILPSPGSKFLRASTQGDYPVALLITKKDKDARSLYDNEFASLCSEPPLSVTRNGKSSAICTIGEPLTEKQTVYFYEFTEGGEAYLVTITQDSPEDATTSTDASKEATDSIDLRKYNDDIRIILQSIKVN